MTRLARLGELFRVGSSKRVLKSQWQSEGVPFYRGREITRLAADGFVQNELFISETLYEGLSGRYGVPGAEDIMVTAIGTIGNSYVVRKGDRFYFKDASVLWLKKTADVSSEFIIYWLKSDQFFEQLDRGNGATVDTLTIQKLQSVGIDLPPLATQRRIVAILDEAFEGIATAKANAEKNLQNAGELFELQLVTALRRGGEGWVEMSIGQACTLRSGTTVPVEIERAAGDVPYVKVAEMTMPANRDGVTTSIRFLDRRDIKQSWLIPAGAVIFPKRGGAILTNKKRLVLVDICADLNIMSVIPSDKITAEFLYLYFLTVDMRKLGTGSSIPQINNYDIAPLPISFPPSRAMQAEVTEALRAAESECQALATIYERKLVALDELKKSLLHQAFTGALTAKSTDKQVAEVA